MFSYPHSIMMWQYRCYIACYISVISYLNQEYRNKFSFCEGRSCSKDLDIQFISTVDQVVDIVTKGFSSARFAVLQSKLNAFTRFSFATRVKDNHQKQIFTCYHETHWYWGTTLGYLLYYPVSHYLLVFDFTKQNNIMLRDIKHYNLLYISNLYLM